MSNRDQTDVWSRELEDLFNYNPPAIKKVENPVTYRLPFAFFDRHIDSQFSLRRVVFVPSFTADIAQVVDRTVLAIKNEGGRLPLIDYEDDEDSLIPKGARNWGAFGNTLTDAISVARFYMEVSFLYCAVVGSTLALNPHSHTWLSVFQSNKVGAEPDEGRSSITSRYYLEIERNADTGDIHIPRGVWDCLDEEARMDITEVSARFHRLATYQFYAAASQYDELLENMGDIVGKEPIPPFPDSVSGFPKQQMPLTPVADSTTLPWKPRELQENHRTEGNKDLKSIEQTTIEPSLSNKHATPPKGVSVSKSTASVDYVTTFVKHAWTRSVMDDTTFIIFHCGKYERIGVRHRATGTLFLSNLIDVHSCRDPGYGKIQVGLYMLIIRDAMERARVFRKLKLVPSVPEPDESRQTKKRPKTRSMTTLAEKEKALVFRECDKRDLAVLQIRNMPLNSPSPAAFIRRGRGIAPGCPCSDIDLWESKMEPRSREYQTHEYFELILAPDFSSGATGQVHRATIRMSLPDGRLLSSSAVVKIAFHNLQRERLRHEYVVYKHLADKGVKSVASIFGFFEDVDDGSSALIMGDAGSSLYQRELKRNPGKISVEQVSVTREERDGFKQALSQIHKAGVRHYDIRPMNLLIDGEGRATIIDFDMAKMGAGRHSRKREFDDLCLLLQSSYSPPNEFPSNPTTQDSHEDSDFLKNP